MIVKNEYVKIKTDKEYVLHNYIYDSYLRLFSKGQLLNEWGLAYQDENENKELTYCFIRFDSPLDNYQKANYTDFNIRMQKTQMQTVGNSKGCNVTYTFAETESVTLIDTGNVLTSLKDYYGKRITAIGFGNWNTIYACVDTSNYSIYLTEGEKLAIIRKDIFESNAECVGYEYPYHLSPVDWAGYLEEYLDPATGKIVSNPYRVPVIAILYSIGIGSQKGVMEEEYKVGTDIEINEESDTVFGFNIRTGLEQSVFPHSNLYMGNGKYPMPANLIKEMFTNTNLQPSLNKYPLKPNTKYIILKYRFVYQYVSMRFGKTMVNTDNYYTMNFYTEAKGLFELKNKIERSN